jgi:outer membrane receptor for ferrienterochelin and colicins
MKKGRYQILCLVAILAIITEISVFATDCSEVSLAEAKKRYQTGNFDEVINLIIPCLENGFNQNEKAEAYRLLSLTFIAIDSVKSANDAANSLLRINPEYQPDYVYDPPKFISIINSLKENQNVTLITTVSKKAENILEAPANVMVITQEDIKRRGYIDLEQFFEDLPGFDVSRTYTNTYSNIYQRGYRSNNTDRTLFLIDGVEENDLWSNAVFWSRQHPISNVKRIEVVYGPASTMYGANALVGVVNVITKEPEELVKQGSYGVKANIGYGTYNTKYTDLTLAGSSGIVSFSATGRVLLSDERDLSQYPEFNYDPNDYNQTDYKNILRVGNGANDFVSKNNIGEDNEYFRIIRDEKGDTVAAELTDAGDAEARRREKEAYNAILNGKKPGYSNTSQQFLFYGKLKIADLTIGYNIWRYIQGGTNYFNDNNEAGYDNGSKWVPKQTFLYVKYNKAITDNILVMNFAQYRTTEVDNESQAEYMLNYSNYGLSSQNFIDTINPFWISEYYYQISRQFRNEFKVNYLPFKDFDIVAGFELRNSSIQGDYRKADTDIGKTVEIGVSKGDFLPGGNDFTIYDLGAYLQATYKFMDQISLTLGGRYDYNRIRVTGGYGSQFNPRIALLITPGDFVFKFIYASAFQNASNWTKFSTNTSRLENNSTLGPEKVSNFESSVSWQPLKNIYLEALYYYSNYDGVVGTRKVYSGGTYTGKNDAIGELKIQGLQFSANYKTSDLEIYANYAFTDPKNNILDSDGNLTNVYQRIGDISSHKLNAGINIIFFEDLNVNLRMNYRSERPVGPNTSVSFNPGHFPDIFLMNGAISYNLMSNLTIQGIVNNIFDKEYFDPGIRSADGTLYAYRVPQRERDFIIRLIYDL